MTLGSEFCGVKGKGLRFIIAAHIYQMTQGQLLKWAMAEFFLESILVK